MELRGRDVSAGVAGDDVALLHIELSALGYAIAPEERNGKRFGEATTAAVRLFQEQHGLRVTGTVDRATASALTDVLSGTTSLVLSVAGRVTDARGAPVTTGTVWAFDVAPDGTTVRPLGESSLNSDGRYRISYPQALLHALAKRAADLVVTVVDSDGRTIAKSAPTRAAKGDVTLDLTVPEPVQESKAERVMAAAAASTRRTVSGVIYNIRGMTVAGLDLTLYHVGFQCEGTLKGRTTTDAQGRYRFDYEHDGVANVTVRAQAVRGREEVALSRPSYNAPANLVLNLVAPPEVAPLAGEYQRMLAEVSPHLGRGSLRDAKENETCRDVTMLARATGWDGRLIAMGASAAQLAVTTGVSEAAIYALLRVGMPADADQLAQLDQSTVELAFRKATASGVVDLTDAQTREAQNVLAAYAKTARRNSVALPGSLSTRGQLLAVSGLTEAEQDLFDGIVAAHGGEPGELWAKARDAGLSDEKVSALQLQGKLAYLTLNNATLCQRLQQDVGTQQNLAKVFMAKDLYKPESWQAYLHSVGGRNDEALAGLIPPAYTGETEAERLALYAEDLARKVRIGMPTHVIARRLETGEMTAPGAGPEVVAVLYKAADAGFRFGSTPAPSFLKGHSEVLDGVADPIALKKHIFALQRVYQTTPDDQSMQIMLDAGLTSAHKITAHKRADFVDIYGSKFASPDIASQVYHKATQVSGVVYNAFAAASQIKSTPPVYAVSASPEVVEESKNNLIKHYPTMERLFGELDFCECDHCRSVLSPAAYLVDLLQFLDVDNEVWQGIVVKWALDHEGAPYPFAGPDDRPDQWGQHMPPKTPYQRLIERRPDLPHLSLSCENTNTVLPYIDIVNEILEYVVAHEQLQPDAVRDINGAQSEDLLAEPQYLVPEAYEKLKDSVYPLGLPFDLWLETVRKLLGSLGVPLPALLEALPPADDDVAILREKLGIGLAEYELLTGDLPWWQLYGYPSESDAAELSNAKALSRRLGVSYRELADLVRTWFVNPDLDALVVLRKLGLDIEDVLRYKGEPIVAAFSQAEREAFEQRLADLTTEHGDILNVKDWLDQTWAAGGFNKVLVLADTDPGCSFDKTTLRYAIDDAPVHDELRKMNLFVRLQRRLGWKLSEVDAALKVLLPAGPFTGAAMAAACAHLARLNELTGRIKAGRSARTALLTLWGPLDAARYAQLFLTPGVKARDKFFDHPLGKYLSFFDGAWKPNTWDSAQPEDQAAGNVGLFNHLSVVQEALNLTAEEIQDVLALDLAALPLTIDIVSQLFRYRLVAKGLKLTVSELITLTRLSGVDPFVDTAATERFVDIVDAVKASGLSVAQLDFLLRHRFDPVGPLAPNAEAQLTLLRTLAGEITRIRTEHAVPDDPFAFTDEVFAQKAALVLPPDVAAKLVAVWAGTAPFEVFVDSATAFDPAPYAKEPSVSLRFDSVLQRQYLAYTGQLPDISRLQADYGPDLFDDLLNLVVQQAREFFETHLVEPVGFLKTGDFDFLFGPKPAAQTDQQWERTRRDQLARKFLSYLQRQLIRTAVLAALASDTGGEPSLVEALTADETLLPEPGSGSALLQAFSSAGDHGLTVAFFASADGSGPALQQSGVIAYASIAGILPPGAASATIDGYLEAATTGAHRFFLRVESPNCDARLRFHHLTEPLLSQSGPGDASQIIQLDAGVPYRFTLDLHDLTGANPDRVWLEVQAENLPRGSVGRLTCHPSSIVDRFATAHVLLSKAVLLATELGLGEDELRHMTEHAADFADFSLAKLPVTAQDSADEIFGIFLRLVGYRTLRRNLRLDGPELLDIFRHARRAEPITPEDVVKDVCARFATLTRRKPETVESAATLLGFATLPPPADGVVTAPGFVSELGLQRLWKVLALAAKLGVVPEALGRWNSPAPDQAVAQDVRSTLKARYEPEAWRRVARPAFDALRKARRDALVAYLMHREGLERMEELYEHYLIDPGTEPVVQTSRLRLAISSVQLFIQRCLLNLEPWVRPGVMSSTQWAWMKRYRVWEANRKIFLWPENLLEPEFLDMKSYQFQELQGTLLQGDVSQDLAEDALHAYLSELDKIARLEIMSVWLEEAPLGPAHNKLHVLGRRYNSTEYFYRTYSHQMWTPWEKVATKIDGDHVVITMWRNRPYLFWLTFLDQAEQDEKSRKVVTDGSLEIPAEPTIRVSVMLRWSEYVNGAWQTPDFDDPGQPKLSAIVAPDFDRQDVFVHAVAHKDADTDAIQISLNRGGDRLYPTSIGNFVRMTQSLSVALGSYKGFWAPFLEDYDFGGLYQSFYLVSRNSEPEVQPFAPEPLAPPFNWDGVDATQYTGKGSLGVWYTHKVEKDGSKTVESKQRDSILGSGGGYTIATGPAAVFTPGSPEIGSLIRPFFYQDNKHTFYVEPTLTEKPLFEYDRWIPSIPAKISIPDLHWTGQIEASVPFIHPQEPISTAAVYPMQTPQNAKDAVVGPKLALQFDEMLVGPRGGVINIKASQ